MQSLTPFRVVMAIVGVGLLTVYAAVSLFNVFRERDDAAKAARDRGGPAMTVPTWEYKVIDVKPLEWRQPGYGTYSERQADPTTFSVSDYEMNTNGVDGWELVSVVPELETTHPGGSVNMRYTKLKFFYKRRKG
jgi:hypothetical protein